MKITDGLFHQVFKEIGQNYPDLEQEFKIIDIGSALLADSPERFDVVVTTNLYGDIISDITAQIGGSVGLAGSSNVGEHLAMFEAIHGSAPDIAGKGIANPLATILASAMMLRHALKLEAEAKAIEDAVSSVLNAGHRTADIASGGPTLSTEEMGGKVVDSLS